jgi:hypothetical protein
MTTPRFPDIDAKSMEQGNDDQAFWAFAAMAAAGRVS